MNSVRPSDRVIPPSSERLGIIGLGAIGRRIATRFNQTTQGPRTAALLVRERQGDEVKRLFPDAIVCTELSAFLDVKPDVVVESASAQTLAHAGPQLLSAGCDIIPLSLGVFADADSQSILLAAASEGRGRIEIPPGALGSIGFLAAAREHQLETVAVTVGYPIERWLAMKADRFIDIGQLQEPTTFMRESARTVAKLFPGHLNVVTGAALAGLGLDQTIVILVADPTVTQAWFQVDAHSASGPVSLRVGGRAAPINADPIDYTTFGVIRLLLRRCAPIAI